MGSRFESGKKLSDEFHLCVIKRKNFVTNRACFFESIFKSHGFKNFSPIIRGLQLYFLQKISAVFFIEADGNRFAIFVGLAERDFVVRKKPYG